MKANKITIIDYKETIQLTITGNELYYLDWALIFANDINHSNSGNKGAFLKLKKDIETIQNQLYATSGEMIIQQKKSKKPIKWDLCNCGTGFLRSDYNTPKIYCCKCGVSKIVKINNNPTHKDYEKTFK